MMRDDQAHCDSPRFAPIPNGPAHMSSLSVAVRGQCGGVGFGRLAGCRVIRTGPIDEPIDARDSIRIDGVSNNLAELRYMRSWLGPARNAQSR